MNGVSHVEFSMGACNAQRDELRRAASTVAVVEGFWHLPRRLRRFGTQRDNGVVSGHVVFERIEA